MTKFLGSGLAALLMWLAGGSMAVAQNSGAPLVSENMTRLLSWFGGEWNNNEQVWQQKLDASDPKVLEKQPLNEHLHHIFAPVMAPQVGDHVFYVQQSRGDDLTKVFRQRLYRFTEDPVAEVIRLDIFGLPDELRYVNAHLTPQLLSELTLTDLKPMSGCEVNWRFDSQQQMFHASMPQDRCNFVSARSGKRIFVNDTLSLSEREIRINDQARDEAGQRVYGHPNNIPSRNRKVRYFDGWVWFKLAGPSAAADDKKTSFTAKYLLHSEGQRISVNHEDGSPSPYMLELAVLTYQNTRKPVLKFALLDRLTLKTLTYVWTNVDATAIGMNLNWFQAGLTQKPLRTSFGF